MDIIKYNRQLKITKAEIEINTIIKLILMGITLIILLFIVNQIFSNNISTGIEEFFNFF